MIYENSKCAVTINVKLTEWFSVLFNGYSLSIKYAHDSTLLVLDFEKLQVAIYELQQTCMKWDMKINFDKSKVLTPSFDNMLIQGEHSEIVNNFIYLGSYISNVNKDIERRIDLALSSFGRIRKSICSNKNIVLKLKIRLYRSSHPEENRRTRVPKCDFNKLLCNFIKITLRHGCSPVNLLNIIRIPFTKNTYGRLLVTITTLGSNYCNLCIINLGLNSS